MNYQPDHIDRLAYSSIFQPNNIIKSQAETQLTRFLFNLPFAKYQQLLETAPENTVLAVAAILRRNSNEFKEFTQQYMLAINSVLMRWYLPKGSIIRGYRGDELQPYILNTFGQFMGNCLKVIFTQTFGKQFIDAFLDSLANLPHYRLFLYYCFIQSVSTIDGDTKYISHRTLLSSFQETMVPRIFQALCPYFMTISDSMEVVQLSFLQSQLSVNQKNTLNRGLYNLSFTEKTPFNELVFKLLDQIIAFRFNLSHRQYENFEDFSNIMISFPESLLAKIINKNFLHALFNILMQLMRTKQYDYQQKCLNCLKKILLAKITYISKAMQQRFIINNLEGVLKLLQLISNQKYQIHRENIVHIMQCNINFINTFGLDMITSCAIKDEKDKIFLEQWTGLTNMIPIYLLQNQNSHIDIKNQQFLVGVEMLVTLANQLKIHSMQDQSGRYLEYYRKYTYKFLQLFIMNGSDIMGENREFLRVEDFKNARQILQQVKIILTYNYKQLFTVLDNYCNVLYMGEAGQHSIGNFILLLAETIRESNFLEESIFGDGIINTRSRQMQEDHGVQMQMFGQILAKTLKFIIRYLDVGNTRFLYLNSAMTCFLSTLVDRCAKKISVGDNPDKPVKPFIDYQVSRQIKGHFEEKADDQEFLLMCLNTLTRFLNISQTTTYQYIFDILHQNIVIIKSNMRRQQFKNCLIYKKMIQFFGAICLQSTQTLFLKSRVSLLKIINTLSFDDTLDEYRGSIRLVVDLLKQQVINQQWPTILYDLTGIFESVTGQTIFRYFLRYLARQINLSQLINMLFTLGFKQPHNYLKDVMHLSCMLVSNKCHRVTSGDNIVNIYQMLALLMPQWIKFLKDPTDQPTMIEMYSAILSIISQNHINICVLDKMAPGHFRQLFKLVLTTMTQIISVVQSSSELSQVLFKLAIHFTQQIAKPLFNIEDPQIATKFRLFINTLMNKLTLSFQSIANGAFEQKLMVPILDTINNYYNFLRNNWNIRHLRCLAMNVNASLFDAKDKEQFKENYQDKQLFLEIIMKIAMEFRHHSPTTLTNIANICVNLIHLSKFSHERITIGLGLNDTKDINELSRIFTETRDATVENEWLASQMKDWLQNKSRFYTPADNDY